MIVARNIGLWFLSVLLSVSLFSLWFFPSGDHWTLKSWLFVFRITMKLALPAALLFLPIVIKKRDAEQGRQWVIAGWGLLIGPASVVFLALVTGTLEQPSDPVGLSLLACLIYAFIVGSLTTILYITALKLVHRLTSRHVLAGHPRL
jgi:hypothetical protein